MPRRCAQLTPIQIAESYRRYGISPSTKDLVVVKITFPTESRPSPFSRGDVEKHLKENVEGTEADFSDANIASTTDWAKVKKYYKLNGINWLESIKDETEKRKHMDSLVLSTMALRGA